MYSSISRVGISTGRNNFSPNRILKYIMKSLCLQPIKSPPRLQPVKFHCLQPYKKSQSYTLIEVPPMYFCRIKYTSIPTVRTQFQNRGNVKLFAVRTDIKCASARTFPNNNFQSSIRHTLRILHNGQESPATYI